MGHHGTAVAQQPSAPTLALPHPDPVGDIGHPALTVRSLIPGNRFSSREMGSTSRSRAGQSGSPRGGHGAARSRPLPPSPVGDTVPCHRKERGPCPHRARTHRGAGPGCRIPLWPPPAWSRRATGRVTSSVTGSVTARSGPGSPAAWRERGRIRDLSRTPCAADSRQPQRRAAAGTGTPRHRAPRGTRSPPRGHRPPTGPVSRRCPGATAGAAPRWRLRHGPVRATRGRDGRAAQPWHRLCRQVQPPRIPGPLGCTGTATSLSPNPPHTGTATAVRDGCRYPTAPLAPQSSCMSC